MVQAYFLKRPRVIADLQKPHLVEEERTYEVVKEILLKPMDYENFITDMVADRQFIEAYADLCSEAAPMKCLLIRRRDRGDGVLVVPGSKAYVKWAAYCTEPLPTTT